jgi:hypothetical protein
MEVLVAGGRAECSERGGLGLQSVVDTRSSVITVTGVLVSAYDLTCCCAYDLTCRSVSAR